MNRTQILKDFRDTLQTCHAYLDASESYLYREDLKFDEKILNAVKMISYELSTIEAGFEYIAQEILKIQ